MNPKDDRRGPVSVLKNSVGNKTRPPALQSRHRDIYI